MHVYLVVIRDELGKVREVRIHQNALAEHIAATFENTTLEILAVIRLP